MLPVSGLDCISFAAACCDSALHDDDDDDDDISCFRFFFANFSSPFLSGSRSSLFSQELLLLMTPSSVFPSSGAGDSMTTMSALGPRAVVIAIECRKSTSGIV